MRYIQNYIFVNSKYQQLAISLTSDCHGLFKALWGSQCLNVKAKKKTNLAEILSIKYNRNKK